MPFPQITLCNNNPFVSKDGMDFVNQILNQSNISDITNSSELRKNYPSSISQLFNNYHFGALMVSSAANMPGVSSKMRSSFSYNANDFFISCLFNLEDCSASDDRIHYYSATYGNCFVFNSGRYENGTKVELKRITQAGATTGLMFELFVRENAGFNSVSIGSGAVLFIQNNFLHPSWTSLVKVSSGASHYIGLDKTVYKQLPSPYS
jgi:hypothetical protein